VRGALAGLVDDGTITELKLDHSPSGGSGEFKCAKDVDIAAKLKVAADGNSHMAGFEIKS
jgi:hypothetical protein